MNMGGPSTLGHHTQPGPPPTRQDATEDPACMEETLLGPPCGGSDATQETHPLPDLASLGAALVHDVALKTPTLLPTCWLGQEAGFPWAWNGK